MQKYFSKKIIGLSSFFLALLVIFSFSPSAQAATGLVPCGSGANDPCTLCHLIVGFKGLLDWGMSILIVAAITAIVIAGVIYIVSSGSSGLITMAKGFLTNAIIGFAIMLGAWLIINTTLTLLSVKSDKNGYANNYFGIKKDSWFKFSCSTVSSTTTATNGSGTPIVATVTNCSELKFKDASSKNQCDAVSPDLQTLLNCLVEKIGGKDKFTISSISDVADGVNCYTNHPARIQCVSEGATAASLCCSHSKNSCHYGGTGSGCAGKSYEIDVEEVSSEIDAAADKCNAKHAAKGNRTHIGISGACSCDAGS